LKSPPWNGEARCGFAVLKTSMGFAEYKKPLREFWPEVGNQTGGRGKKRVGTPRHPTREKKPKPIGRKPQDSSEEGVWGRKTSILMGRMGLIRLGKKGLKVRGTPLLQRLTKSYQGEKKKSHFKSGTRRLPWL